MADDEFDFSDDDLDDLPANTLQDLEATAIRATQQQTNAAPDSDYGLDDGDEVVNLDDAPGPQHASPWNAPQATQPQQQYYQDDYAQNYDYDHGHNGVDRRYDDQMEVEEPPSKSQADPDQLLQRIKKVRHTAP
jgi:hypothetical protein